MFRFVLLKETCLSMSEGKCGSFQSAEAAHLHPPTYSGREDFPSSGT